MKPPPTTHARLLSLLTARDYRHDVSRDLVTRRYSVARLRRARAIVELYGLDRSVLDEIETADQFDEREALLVILDRDCDGPLGQLPLREFLAESQGNATGGKSS
jgi:hypothetical protein